jgi:hypothetical protein
VDWNNDGKKDLISGDTKGQVWLFLNEGTDQAPELAAGVRVEADGVPIIAAQYAGSSATSSTAKAMGTYSKLHYGDWNDDGLKDLLVGQSANNNWNLVFYENIGDANTPKFAAPQRLALPGSRMSRPSPYIVDWDGDGKQDLLFGTERAAVYFFRNRGTNKKPELEAGKPLGLTGGDFSKGYRSRLDVTDWNEDGKLDLLIGNFYSYKKPMGGNIWLFLGI